MLFPLSWIKEFVDIKLPIEELAWKLTEAGLTVEKWETKDGDIIFEPEITPNRPDWMRVVGVAREIAAVTNVKLKNEKIPTSLKTAKENPGIKIKNDFALCPRYCAVVIKGVKVKPSPDWLQKRLKQIGLRPINNLVDLSNYVMWEQGNPLHIFDLDKIRGKQMVMEEAKGGEAFRSLDGLDYTLPKGAIIFKDLGRIIDLCGLKGGDNTAVTSETTNVLIHVPVYEPSHLRRTSQALGLRSDASAIFERGANPGGTLAALERAADLVLQLAGGQISLPALDLKEKDFAPWSVELRHDRLEIVLGISVEAKRVVDIFDRLGLKTTMKQFNNSTIYNVTIPTFRNDIHIEEDLIEEVGRIYGYNNFPKTLPQGAVPTTKVAYAKNYDFESNVKQILKGAGYTEIYTYSLISENQLVKLGINPNKTLRVDNPISRDYEYLRPNLFGNILDAYKQNQANSSEIRLFEIGKRYQGENLDKVTEEFWLWAILSGEKYFEGKGVIEILLQNIGVPYLLRPTTTKDNHYWLHPGRTAHLETKDGKYLGVIGEVHPSLLGKWGIKGQATTWGLNYGLIEKLSNQNKKYQPIAKYPSLVEDITLIVPEKVHYSNLVDVVKKSNHLVSSVELLGTHENSQTFRIAFLDRTKNLTEKDVAEVQTKILKNLKVKLEVRLKEKSA